MAFINLNAGNIADKHICCAFADKKCADGYRLKKDWLTGEFANGYVFRRLDERAKVFIEYGPAEYAWMPVEAQGYLALGCFWVSGSYKGKGHARNLLQDAITDARQQGKDGLISVVGTKKFRFMSETRWLLEHGFSVCDQTSSGFSLLSLSFSAKELTPRFGDTVRSGECPDKQGVVVYYSDRCPFCDFYVNQVLVETVLKRGLPMKIIKLDSLQKAKSAPTPATIFSLFYNGQFVTTDLGVCLDNRFDKIVTH